MAKNKKSKLVDATKASPFTNVIYNIIFILFAAMCIYPMLVILGSSMATEDSLNHFGYRMIPKEFGTDAYVYLMNNAPIIMRAYAVTIFSTVVGTILAVLNDALYGYAISRPEFKWRKQFTFLQFFPMLFSGGLVPWYLICTRFLNLTDTIWALILPMVNSSWNIIILKTFFSTGVPDGIIESARIDGAHEFKTFFKIVWPIALPGIATIALFAMLGFWNNYTNALYLINDKSLQNLQLYLFNILENISALTNSANAAMTEAGHTLSTLPKEGARMAMCIVTVGPIVLAYPFFQRYFIQGLTIGSIKG